MYLPILASASTQIDKMINNMTDACQLDPAYVELLINLRARVFEAMTIRKSRVIEEEKNIIPKVAVERNVFPRVAVAVNTSPVEITSADPGQITSDYISSDDYITSDDYISSDNVILNAGGVTNNGMDESSTMYAGYNSYDVTSDLSDNDALTINDESNNRNTKKIINSSEEIEVSYWNKFINYLTMENITYHAVLLLCVILLVCLIIFIMK